jgi:hypothetical protein
MVDNHPRLGTGKDWYIQNGYFVKCINGKYTFQHIHVMEEFLGRALLPKETIHHINGDKTDNRIENLELFSSQSEHMKKHASSEVMKERSKLGHKARWNYESNL